MDKAEFDKQVAAGRALVIINGSVYDVEEHIPDHSGGELNIRERLGKDASEDFNGKPHSAKAVEYLKKFLVAEFKE